MRRLRLLALPLLFTACAEEAAPAAPAAQVIPLTPTEHLVRAAMALTGTRPPLAALQVVAADPAALEPSIDRLLEMQQFGETIRDLHNDALLMRFDLQLLPHVDKLAERGYTRAEVNRSVMEEPLRLIEQVVVEDRPYTEIVTTGTTMADQVVADVWGLDYDEGAGGWQELPWEDGRPAAGILSTSALWYRHRSAGFNLHRERANLVSKALLCWDFLARELPIDGSIDLSDPKAVAHAVVINEDCASCHVTLDPLAGYFSSFRPFLLEQLITSYPVAMYQPENADEWIETTGRPPGYFGDQGGDVAALGRKIAADPRFSLCAARRFYGYLAGVDPASVSIEILAPLQQRFVESGFSAKALARAVVLSEAFRASHATDEASAAALPGYKKARPEQLARLFADLTGFRWEATIPFELDGAPFGKVDLASSDLFGFRSLAGGIDSYYVTTPTRTMSTSASLFLRRYAARAAGHVVEADFAAAADARKLLRRVEAETSDEASVRAQLVDLHLRLYGEVLEPGDVPITESWSIFRGVLQRTGDVRHAWKTLLTAMLQDLKVAYY